VIKRLVFAAALTLVPIVSSTASAAVMGTVTVARLGANALVLWDCTERLSALRDTKTPNSDILKAVEAEGALVLAQSSSDIGKQSQTLTVRALYKKLGTFNPQYRAVTFAGVERLVTLTAKLPVTGKQAAAWSDAFKAGHIPKDVKIEIIGELPPQ